MVVRAYAVCIRVKPECRWMESEMVGDGQGHADEADEAYHDRSTEFMDKQSSILFVFMYMKGGSAGPWVTQKINRILDAANPAETTWAEFMIELDEMFVDLNCQATARRKLATLHQGDSSVEELIQEFKIHGSISGLGNVGLVNHFEQAIHLWLCESIYHLKPMPTTWAEWKCKASLLDNQWRHFWDRQPKAAAN